MINALYSMWTPYKSNWNLEIIGYWGKRKTRKKSLGARMRTNNKLNPHVTPSPGIKPGPHWWETSALTTVQSLLSCSKEIWHWNSFWKLGHIALYYTYHTVLHILLQGCCSGESTRLPPMLIKPRFDFQTRHHMWVEFVVGSRPCSPSTPVFPLSSKTNISKFQFDMYYCQALYHEPLAWEIAQVLPCHVIGIN